ncbi:hypothetical protein L596_005945 [Steinernema carpocapsae]|uniref:Uncharacterized protein n=1 Tax=Steinernema carpocapsae TaxID=34508 RepID=A0A4U8V0M9_STECR|nr:hypothetical protein L596_005945 [Steinernema carpocapsae]
MSLKWFEVVKSVTQQLPKLEHERFTFVSVRQFLVQRFRATQGVDDELNCKLKELWDVTNPTRLFHFAERVSQLFRSS